MLYEVITGTGDTLQFAQTEDPVERTFDDVLNGFGGACHTPRGLMFQEKAMSDAGSNGDYFLAGETVENWRALSLRNLWTVEDTALFLKTGQNRFATASGNMTEVIMHSYNFV